MHGEYNFNKAQHRLKWLTRHDYLHFFGGSRWRRSSTLLLALPLSLSACLPFLLISSRLHLSPLSAAPPVYICTPFSASPTVSASPLLYACLPVSASVLADIFLVFLLFCLSLSFILFQLSPYPVPPHFIFMLFFRAQQYPPITLNLV